jgi:triosephosphate isomerase
MSLQKTIVGNWKMHGTPESARELARAIAACPLPSGVKVVICPPATLFSVVAFAEVPMGGQDCSAEAEGAFTGDISASMLKEAGCDYVIVGHSERRHYHDETNEDVRNKATQAIAAGLIPIVCIGETAAERDAGNAKKVVGAQVAESLPKFAGEDNVILAYEPVWAIGTGKTPKPEDIRAMHAHILAVAAHETGLAPSQISVLYGGSVKSANAQEILALNGVSGVLVGGASLKADEFCKIAQAAGMKG